MASLPAGWAADYDGARWFFRYAATSHTQYHFPTPGDEFPDPFGGGGGFPESSADLLLPEERLESERQVRQQRATLDGGRGAARKIEREEEDGEGDGGFVFEDFGYLGPGSYEDGAGGGREESVARAACELAGGGRRRRLSVDAVSSLTSAGGVSPPVSEPRTFTIVGDEQRQAQRSTAVELPSKSQPSSSSPPAQAPAVELSSTSQSPSSPPARTPAVPPLPRYRHPADEIPLLDSREIGSRRGALGSSPAGRVAELVSESTARCADEISPPPVELPDTNGASWLAPVPVPNLVNQYPVELPAVDAKLETLGARRRQENRSYTSAGGRSEVVVARGQQAGRAVDEERDNSHAWQTNWMSTTPPQQAHGPSRPPKVASRADLPSRQNQGPPQVPPKIPPPAHEEVLHREIPEHFPARHTPQHTNTTSSPSPTTSHHETRDAWRISPAAPDLNHFPSVLRPGPRRASQPAALPLGAGASRNSGQASPPGTQFRAFQPAAAGGRPHSQSVVAEQSALRDDGRLRMPKPEDHVRVLRVPRSQTLQTIAPTAPSSSPSPTSLHFAPPSQSPRREPLHFVIPVHHVQPAKTTSGANEGRISMPSEPSPELYCPPQRPSGFAKMPSEPAWPVGMPSPPMHESTSARDAGYAAYSPPHERAADTRPSPDAVSPLITPDAEQGSPPTSLGSRTSTSLSTMSAADGAAKTRLRAMMKRIARLDSSSRGEEGGAGAGPSFVVLGAGGAGHLPHEYVPPKGKQREASEWSLGHAG